MAKKKRTDKTIRGSKLQRKTGAIKKRKRGTLPFDCKDKKSVLATRLHHAMEQRGMSTAEVAYGAGCSDVTIGNVLAERGVILNNGNTLLGIACALRVETDWLLGHVPHGSDKVTGATSQASSAHRRGASRFKKVRAKKTTAKK